jgi:hypothetical protein
VARVLVILSDGQNNAGEVSLERAMLGFLAVSQSPFGGLTGVCVHQCNLLKARMIVTTLYLVCIFPIRSFSVRGELDRVSAGGRSHPEAH